MYSTAYSKRRLSRTHPISICAFIRGIIFPVLCCFSFFNGNGQSLNLSLKSVKLEVVFREIEKQTAYRFVYTRETMEDTHPVSIRVANAALETVLNFCFENQPVSYSILDQIIMVKARAVTVEEKNEDLRGRVISEKGEAVVGATVLVKDTDLGTATEWDGGFLLKNVPKGFLLLISSVGYKGQAVRPEGRTNILVVLESDVSVLDETMVIAYGTTTRRLSTGNVSRIGAKEISMQPVANPLAALQGRAPGVVVTQSSGLPGASFKVQIRGRNSLVQGSEPLFIIDGVPFAPNNQNINKLSSILTAEQAVGLSPFNSINPADIESMEILKDADATAIYGSRGANGVVLITTKKGRPGKTNFNFRVYQGSGSTTRRMKMLTTAQYLVLRREAFVNDAIIPTALNAPDLLVWDTTRNTDFSKMLLGGRAQTTDAQASVSGGTENTQFYLGAGYHREGTVFPGDMKDKRGSLNANIHHRDKKFDLVLSSNFSSDRNNLININLPYFINLPPNLPTLYDSTGRLRWAEKGVSFDNPLAYLQYRYEVQTDNLISHLQLSYEVLPGLHLGSGLGYNLMNVRETSIIPKAAQNPALNPAGSSQFGSNEFRSWVLEPQIRYAKKIAKGRLETILGLTAQQTKNAGSFISATGFASDALLQSLAAGTVTEKRNSFTDYKYKAVFGRVSYNWEQKYLANFSGRRDGSSRFGSGKQFANFGSAGAAWIFSNEKFFKNRVSFLSFGKLRASYGSSGNDQIGDYKYLEAWGTTLPYQGQTSLLPQNLFNEDYQWEINRKMEGALDLGFLKDRLLFSAAYFRNRSSNHLINYRLPSQTGFTGIVQNFPAIVQNTGWEFELSSHTNLGPVEISNAVNLSIPRNRLITFENLSLSSYAFSYVIGKPLNLLYTYQSAGVDAQTGVYKIEDRNRDNKITAPDDWYVSGNLDPKFYGGMQNSFSYKEFELNLFFEFKKQKGRNYLYSLNSTINVPGARANQPLLILDRWQKAGDQKEIQKFTTISSGPAYTAASNFIFSDAIYSDASYLRLKTLSAGYSFTQKKFSWFPFPALRVFIQGQNLFTLSGYKGADPEVQQLYALPPLKTMTAGLEITL